MERDPRKDPRKGDVIAKPGVLTQDPARRVDYVGEAGWKKRAYVWYNGGMCCLIATWRKWAKTADVMVTADEA